MTRVRRPTSGFMSEAAVRTEQTLTDQHRQKDRGLTSGSSAREAINLLSDIAAGLASCGALLAGARALDRHECQHTQTRRIAR
jgi:hypothetical protein